jgi:hypothetical protein
VSDPEQPKETERDYFAAIGHALTTWSIVEQHAYQIFGFVLENPKAAYHAYWAIHSFEERLLMTHRAFKGRFHENTDLIGNWNALRKRMIEQNRTRNDIAHGTVLGMIEADHAPTFKLIPFMWASFGDPKKQPHDNGMTLKEIKDATEAFKALWIDMGKFLSETLSKIDQPKNRTDAPPRSGA